jgi:hypothetical protein
MRRRAQSPSRPRPAGLPPHVSAAAFGTSARSGRFADRVHHPFEVHDAVGGCAREVGEKLPPDVEEMTKEEIFEAMWLELEKYIEPAEQPTVFAD